MRPRQHDHYQLTQVYGRKLFIYNCDPFTLEFYKKWMEFEQVPVAIEEEPDRTVPFPIPPHVGVGTEEDTLGSMIFFFLYQFLFLVET